MTHFGRLDAMGAAYRVPEPSITSMKELPSGEWEFVLEPSIEGSEIRYTTDGTYPTVHSALYKGGKVVAPSRSDFHAVTLPMDAGCRFRHTSPRIIRVTNAMEP